MPKENIDIRAVLFDMDGTLINTEILYVEAVTQAFSEKDCEISQEEIIKLVYGVSWPDIYKATNQRFPGAFPTMESLGIAVRRHFVALRDKMDIRIHSSIDLLKQLSSDYSVAIVSGAPRFEIEEGIEMMGVASHLDFFLGAEDYHPGKPDPTCYLAASEKMNCKPENCIVFEDSHVGVLAAKQAGMHCVGLLRKNVHMQDLSHADLVLDDLADFDMQKFTSNHRLH